jgi:type IX secretion system PorP/SprF family membrane protein
MIMNGTTILRMLSRCCALALFSLAMTGSVRAQDPHFSQYFNTPQAINPALTGVFDGSARFCNNYRSQWTNLGEGYKTLFFSAEALLARKRVDNKFFGAGLMFYQDRAGVVEFKKTIIEGALSFTTAIDERAGHWISFGIQGGLDQLAIDPSKATWDQQWNGNNYDPTLASTEVLRLPSFSYPDVQFGANYFHVPDGFNSFSAGFSVSHLLKPNITFFPPNTENLYNRKLTVHSSSEISLDGDHEHFFNPRFLFQLQGKQAQAMAGGYFRNKLRLKSLYTGYQKESFFDIGCFYRYRESIIGAVKFSYNSIGVGFSYDVGFGRLSRLVPANTWEISLSFVPGIPRGERKFGIQKLPRFF